MFDVLTKRLNSAFAKIKGKLTENVLDDALDEIKIALLESDVALPVVKKMSAGIKEKSVGIKLIAGVNAGEQIAKLVYDELVEILGGSAQNLTKAHVILMAGLQGTGKTTSAAKLAKWFSAQGKSVLLASADIYRPAAKEQLEMLAARAGARSLPIIANEKPIDTAKRALASKEDIIIIDTAGRTQIDAALMDELRDIKTLAKPDEVLLTADAMMGQTSVDVAREFNTAVGITGIILTRADSDANAGVALSMKYETGAPIVFTGTGEGVDALEQFYPDRIASRILDMGDIVSLVEKAQANIDEAQAQNMTEKMFSGQFDLSDMLAQIRQIKKLGSLGGILKMLPGAGKLSAGIKDKLNDSNFGRQEAIILSMTPRERAQPDIIFASRKQRIAKGSGVSVRDVEKLLDNYAKMKSQMKQLSSMGGMSGLMEMMKGKI
ncbi:MAG: signal recognition particle protein [Rickettsiales bacterium]|jgi:signal recognition particle subunit SRP54|nr:signal recognition particle protein [Rickettsiales bacterium]